MTALLFTTGCAGLYNQRLHETAQGAHKSLVEAKLVESVREERTQNAEILARELAVVEQERIAARNEQLLNILNERTYAATVAALQKRIDARLTRLLAGDTARAHAGDLSDAAGHEQTKQERLLRYARARRADDPKPGCSGGSVEGPARTAWTDLQETCEKLKQANDKIAAPSASGEIAELSRELVRIERARTDVAGAVEQAAAAFRKAEKDAKAARDAGAPTDLVVRAKELQAQLAAVNVPSDEAIRNAGIADARLLGRLAWLEVQKGAVERLLEAAAMGATTVPPSLADDKQIAAIIPTLHADLQKAQAPPVVKLALEAERLRVDRDRVKQQLARLDEEIALLHRKRNLMLRERETLDAARETLLRAPASCGADATATLRTATSACRHALATALVNFTNAWTLYRIPARKIDWKLVNLEHDRVLDSSETALQQWNGLLVPALEVLVANYGSGVKADSLGRMLGNLELGWIALGVH